MLYQVFDISMPEWTDDFSVALVSSGEYFLSLYTRFYPVSLLFFIFKKYAVFEPLPVYDILKFKSFIDPSAVKSSWQLYEGYIVAEGMDILPYTSNDRFFFPFFHFLK